MASLSNINGIFDVHSTGAILFSTSHGTSGQILKSNGNAAPTWVDASTVIGGPYLPLSGGTLTGATATASGISFTVGGALTGTSATFSGTLTVGGNNVVGFNGSWNGADMPGSRWNGYSVNGGEIVFQRDNPNSGQMSILVDGGYYAGENNGFYSLYSSSSYNSKAGFYADTSGVLQFNAPATFTGLVSGITPTAAANFTTKAYVDAHPGSGGTVTSIATGNGLNGGTITSTGTLSMSGTYSGRFNPTGYQIVDTRAGDITPADEVEYSQVMHFTNQVPGNSNWQSLIQMKGWHDGYTSWQIIGPSTTTAYENWYLRSGVGTTWNTAREIWHSGNFTPGNYLPLTGGTMSGQINAQTINFDGVVSGTGAGGQIGRNHAYDTLELKGYGAEMMIGSQNTDLHINYRTCNGGTAYTPNNWFWRAGSSTSFSNHSFGIVTSTNLKTNSFSNYAGSLLFSAGNTTTGASRSLNLRTSGSTSDPSSSDDSNSTGITWGQRTDSNPYYIIYPQLENWSSSGNYSKLTLAWHTGIKIGADKVYGGTRFYNQSPDISGAAVILNVGVGNDNIGIVNALTVGGEAGIGTTVTTGGFNVNNANSGSYYNMSNNDSGNFKYTNPNGRLLTSNGTGWVADGRDPILTLSSAGNGGATTVGYSVGLNLYSNTATNNTYSPLICFSNLSNSGNYATAYAAIGGKKVGAGTDSNWSTGELHFWTAGPTGSGSASYMQQASAMMIDDAGNVGIGTNSPTSKLHVFGGSANTELKVTTNDNYIARIGMYEEEAGASHGGFIQYRGELSDRLEFGSKNSGTDTVHMSISDSYGNVGIGTAPNAGVAGDRLKIQGGNNGLGCLKAISGQYSYAVKIEGSNLSTQLICYSSSTAQTTQINFENPGNSSAGKITTTGNSTAYVTSSDYRLKENVIPISDSISRLNQLKPSRFNFIGESNKTVDGFIAHEVQDIVPEAIVGEKDEVDEDGGIIPQGIDQAKLVPLLVAALQELEARVKELENK